MSASPPAARATARTGDRVIETHVSVLSFEGDIVRKRKKAVRFPFIDLTSPQLRLAACRQEVALNRRLAPDVYLGVAETRDRHGRLTDAAVVMRRLPDDRRLSALIDQGADVRDELARVARVLAAFHSRARRGPAIDRAGTRRRLRNRWDADLGEWEPLVRRVLGVPGLDRERSLARRYLDGRGELLRRRIAAGHIVDGHGDLLTDDICCLPDGPRILDCLEFDARLRHGDELADVAFLAMDLEARGRPDLAEYFERRYLQLCGEDFPPSLLHFYIAQRAMVRSKVSCWGVIQGDAASTSRARAHLDQCRRHLEAARPLLVVIGGPPRTGKSTIAGLLADATGWIHLSSDEVRRDVAAVPRVERAGRDPLDSGMYAAAVTAATYAALTSRAGVLLRAGYAVILDATFTTERSRSLARRVARECRSDLVELECHAPASVVRERMGRASAHQDLSEATPDVAAALRSRRLPWPTAHALDTTMPEAAAVATCRRIIDATPIGPPPTAQSSPDTS